MSASQTPEPATVSGVARAFVRDRLVADEALFASQQVRAAALLRTVTAIAAFVLAGLAFLRNSDIDLPTASLIVVTVTFIALASSILFASLALVPKRRPRPDFADFSTLMDHTGDAGTGEAITLSQEIAAYEANFVEQLISVNDKMENLLRFAFVGEIISAGVLLVGFFVILPSL